MLLEAPPIDRATAYHVVVPFKRLFATAHGVLAARSSWILRLRDAQGAEGFGEIALDPGATTLEEGRLAAAVREAVAELEAGQFPERSCLLASRAEGRAILAGIDGALDSLLRAASGDPNGPRSRESVAVNATLSDAGAEATAEAAIRAVAAGFTCLKLKVGPEITAALVDRVAAVSRG